MKRTSVVFAALAGLAAAGLGLGVSEAIAGILPGATSLVDAIGQVVIDLQPPGAKDFVVELFGTNDKLALEIVVTVAALALGAAFGVAAARRFAIGAIGFAVFGVLGFVAGVGQLQAVPAIVAVQAAAATGVGIQTLSWLLGWLGARQEPATPAVSDPARRSFLLRTGAVGIGALGRRRIRSERDRGRSHFPGPIDTVAGTGRDGRTAFCRRRPRAGRAGIDADRRTQRRTSTGSTRRSWCRSLDTATWRLRIHGLVERETTLEWDELDRAATVRAVRDDRLRQQRGRRRPRRERQVDRRPTPRRARDRRVRRPRRRSSSVVRSMAGRPACRWTG